MTNKGMFLFGSSLWILTNIALLGDSFCSWLKLLFITRGEGAGIGLWSLLRSITESGLVMLRFSPGTLSLELTLSFLTILGLGLFRPLSLTLSCLENIFFILTDKDRWNPRFSCFMFVQGSGVKLLSKNLPSLSSLCQLSWTENNNVKC